MNPPTRPLKFDPSLEFERLEFEPSSRLRLSWLMKIAQTKNRTPRGVRP